ncbi:MAG TPA: hypothetical protein VFZ01_08255 [Geminicoccaceae bacterium]
MQRRRVIMALGLTALGLAFRPFGAWAAPGPARLPGARDLVRTLRHRASAARVGAAYLAGHDGEQDVERLVAALNRGLDDRSPERRRLRAALDRRIRADFAESETVRVQGWVLSRTEARLCALAALESGVA